MKRMTFLFRYIYSFLFIALIVKTADAQTSPEFLNFKNDPWVEKTLSEMTLDQKIGQLFILQAYGENLDKLDELKSEVEQYHVGGLIFMRGKPENQVQITNQLQAISDIPLLVTMDAEWGPGFRLDNTPKYPVQMALGAIQQDSLIYEMGKEVGEQLKRIGVHVNLAPVADVNSNPENPVINYRSFGEDPQNVAEKTWLYAKGMQDAGILAVAKHFPGHGDTKTDSHLGLPVVSHDMDRLNDVELFPFKSLINEGIGGIMTAHLQLSVMEPDGKTPSSLSYNIVHKKLIEDLKFEGIIITDGMNMQGITDAYGSAEASVLALKAGNDLLEIVPNLSAAINAVKLAIQDGEISQMEIDEKCRKILALKKWAGLDEFSSIPLEGLDEDLNNAKYQLTKRLLHEQSLTLLKNEGQLIPIQNLERFKIAVVSVGSESETSFQKMAANYTNVDFFNLKEDASSEDVAHLVPLLRPYNLLVCGIHGMNLSNSGNYGIDSSVGEFLTQTSEFRRAVALFGNPYALNSIPGIEDVEALLVTYQENVITQELAAQAIFGAINVNGKLPVNVNSSFKLNEGLTVKKNGRFKYTIPEETGISSELLNHKIDSLAELGLTEGAYPGCQILVAVDGDVIFHKCYGYLTYDTLEPVVKENIYDWASVTKVTSVIPSLIKLYGDNQYNLDLPFSFYWPGFRGTDKEKITSREILTHQARLRAGIQFWQNTLTPSGRLRASIYQDRPTEDFNVRISSHLYMARNYIREIYDEIDNSELYSRSRYRYSDLAFMIYPRVIEDLTGEDFETYLKNTFYKPLGANSVTYNAYRYYPMEQIVPTEQDDSFRKELLRGFVHDEGASMLGGLSGNAGLFGTVNDLAKIMQMYLQNGYYGGEQLLDSTSVAEFTRIQYPENDNRRGLGFDKPYIDNDENELIDAYPAVDASPESFGHTGYTGIFTWADPQNKMLLVFCSNRVYPTRDNNKITELNLRPELHQAIYDCMKEGWKY